MSSFLLPHIMSPTTTNHLFRTGSCSVVQTGVALTAILLFRPPKSWDHGCEVPCPPYSLTAFSFLPPQLLHPRLSSAGESTIHSPLGSTTFFSRKSPALGEVPLTCWFTLKSRVSWFFFRHRDRESGHHVTEHSYPVTREMFAHPHTR